MNLLRLEKWVFLYRSERRFSVEVAFASGREHQGLRNRITISQRRDLIWRHSIVSVIAQHFERAA